MTTILPIGTSGTALAANELSLLATYEERLCKPFCVDSTLQPQYSISYTYSSPILDGSTVFVPITAIITIVLPNTNCTATTRIYSEPFDVAFQGQTAIPTLVTIESKGRTANGERVSCGKAKNYSISDSLSISIA
jgi:hypothetical protein